MNDLFTITSLFIIISILFVLEASTSLARIAGLKTGNLASGLQLQSGLSLFSRALMAIFMPMLGGLADSGFYNEGNLLIVYFSTLYSPIFLCVLYAWKNQLLGFYSNSAINLVKKGSYFPIRFDQGAYKWPKNGKSKLGKLSKFRKITFLAYIPYFLTWPIVIILLSYYPERRGFIIGLSSIMNGITTLALVLYVDPILIKLSRYKKLSIIIYRDQLKIRIYSAMLATTPFVFSGLFILFTA